MRCNTVVQRCTELFSPLLLLLCSPLFHLRGSSTLGSPISSSSSLAPAIGDLLVSTNMHVHLILISLRSKPLQRFNEYVQMPCQGHLGATRMKSFAEG